MTNYQFDQLMQEIRDVTLRIFIAFWTTGWIITIAAIMQIETKMSIGIFVKTIPFWPLYLGGIIGGFGL